MDKLIRSIQSCSSGHSPWSILCLEGSTGLQMRGDEEERECVGGYNLNVLWRSTAGFGNRPCQKGDQ